MIAEIRLYIEGGGNRKDTRIRLRTGFGAFLREIRDKARPKRIRWHIEACGGRRSAYDRFALALRSHPAAFNILLVYAEGPVRADNTWDYLRNRHEDQWKKPAAGDDQCHLMVQSMEAWLIADRERLAEYFGKGFHEKSLPRTRNVEQIDKQVLATSLEKAAKPTSKKGYDKTRDAPRILERIRASVVQDKAPHCRRLFVTLADKIEAAAD